ncbi:MAG TPA: hypothetical protein VE642_07810 [Pyrinomonadaceae bacterium]|jgi:hypothetical protein|nr:hypothetical protein [Pyrinomonadaceae bacterium]
MPISANIQEIADIIAAEVTQSGNNTSQTADALHVKAVAAIFSGGQVVDGHAPEAWEIYMNTFAKSTDELARLIPTDGTENDPDKRDARAYLVANGTCGGTTTMNLLVRVTIKLDL